MPLSFDQENNSIAECAEGRAPSTAQRQPLHAGQRGRETTRQADREGQTEQPREEKKNNETDRDKQQHNKRTRQDKRTTDC